MEKNKDKRKGEQKRLYGNQYARKHPIFKPKLKVGDKVWLQIPVNGSIHKVTKHGYEIKVVDGCGTYSYYTDEQIRFIN